MPQRVLILQSDQKSGILLSDYFTSQGDRVLLTADSAKLCDLLRRVRPDLIFIDLHAPGHGWLIALKCIRKLCPNANVIVTDTHPDLRRKVVAKQLGVRVFLRLPFQNHTIENALGKLRRPELKNLLKVNDRGKIPRVRIPMRIKITLPYAILALLFALASAFLVGRFVMESIQERFLIQLIDTGKLSSDWMVQEEKRLLETVRLLANTEGIANAVEGHNAERLREIVLPVAINYGEEVIDILDKRGISVLSMHRGPGESINDYEFLTGDTDLGTNPIVQRVIRSQVDQRGDKYAGLAQVPWGDYLYVIGPIIDVDGSVAGVVVVGKSITSLVRQIRQDTLGHVSIYDLDGKLLATTLLLKDAVHPISNALLFNLLQNQDAMSSIREMSIASARYSEILGPWEVRDGQDIGIIGTSLAQNLFPRPTVVTRIQAFLVVILAAFGVITLGIVLAHQITTPLYQIIHGAIEVAKGNLEANVSSKGNDEVMVLAHAFNNMVSGLKEGFIYRDLLGRTVSPQVRETLRHSFASGTLRLEGKNYIGTVLITDIRGFTTISEKMDPEIILNWMNEYFGEIVPLITSLGGVVDKFEGDSMLAFFGILPVPLPPEESAYHACKAAIGMLRVIEKINQYRSKRGEPSLVTGIGVNTGTLTAGGLGTSDRLNYTVIGDTVNTTQRIESFSQGFGESGIVISETTLSALKNHRNEFRLEPLGEHTLKGKLELMWLYRLYPRNKRKD